MAKRRKKSRKGKMPAALKKYWAAKRAGKVSKKSRRKSRKSSRKARKSSHRRRHVVHAHKVSSYRRPRKGKQYMSNPFGGVGQTGSAVMGGLVAVGVLFGSLFAVGYLNGMKNRVPMLASGWGSLAAKLAIGLGVGMAATWANRRGWLSHDKVAVVAAAGFAPLGLDLLGRVAPGIAGSITLAEDDEMSAGLSMTPGNRLSDNTIDAEMSAEMSEGESEVSTY